VRDQDPVQDPVARVSRQRIVKPPAPARRPGPAPSRSPAALGILLLSMAGLVALPANNPARAGGASGPQVITSSLQDATGKLVTATNHLVAGTSTGSDGTGEFLLVWAGDYNVADTTGGTIPELLKEVGVSPDQPAVDLNRLTNAAIPDQLPGFDFLAVIDADPASPTYGKVVNTVTVAPLIENEPHHMQYI